MEEIKMGRPPKKIDKKEFEKLCALQCTKEEICGFSEVFREKRGTGKISLRRMQFQLAKKSAAMAIFLGKNWLGQTDKGQGIEDAEDDGFMDALKESADVWDE